MPEARASKLCQRAKRRRRERNLSLRQCRSHPRDDPRAGRARTARSISALRVELYPTDLADVIESRARRRAGGTPRCGRRRRAAAGPARRSRGGGARGRSARGGSGTKSSPKRRATAPMASPQSAPTSATATATSVSVSARRPEEFVGQSGGIPAFSSSRSNSVSAPEPGLAPRRCEAPSPRDPQFLPARGGYRAEPQGPDHATPIAAGLEVRDAGELSKPLPAHCPSPPAPRRCRPAATASPDAKRSGPRSLPSKSVARRAAGFAQRPLEQRIARSGDDRRRRGVTAGPPSGPATRPSDRADGAERAVFRRRARPEWRGGKPARRSPAPSAAGRRRLPRSSDILVSFALSCA